MIQGFETREITDIPIRAFVESAKGILHKRQSTVGQYEQTIWPTYKSLDKPIAVFGVLRGTGKLIRECMSKFIDFYYFDHAYVLGNRHSSSIINDKVYRITKNNFSLTTIDKLTKDDYERIEKYKQYVDIKPWKKEGRYILVSAPSDHAKTFYNRPNWLNDTVLELKKHTKLDIVIRDKGSTVSLSEQLKEAFACVSFQSTVCLNAVLNGIPSFCDELSCGVPVSKTKLSEINEPNYSDKREQWLYSLLANQFTLKEIKDGVAWNKVK